MPIIKTRREDVLRNAEIDRMLARAEKGVAHYYPYKDKAPDEFGFDTINFNPKTVQCLIALLWLFGKRITENLELKRKDVWICARALFVVTLSFIVFLYLFSLPHACKTFKCV